MKSLYFFVLFALISCVQVTDNEDVNSNQEIEMEEDSTSTEPSQTSEAITYLALGDSYTIGESVAEIERWPVQLVSQLKLGNINILKPTIVATTGWTTDELQVGISSTDLKDSYDIVSLLIGVNNQYRGYPIDQYRTEFTELLNQALAFSGNKDKTFVVSIPDYGVTPFGQRGDPDRIARELDEYNAIAKSIATEKGVKFFDITPISREAKTNPALIAPDGLHPSGEMYRQWTELIVPWAIETLGE